MRHSVFAMLGAAALTAISTLALAQGPTAAGTPPASGKSGVNVGSLQCKVAGGMGFIFGSSKDLDCLLVRTDGVAEHYAGSINRYGVDIGFTKEAHIVWLVFAPGAIGPGALAGDYGGVKWDQYSLEAYVNFLYERDLDDSLVFNTDYLQIFQRSFWLSVLTTVGCLLIGYLYGLFLLRPEVPVEIRSGLMVGFLGGLTTFSSFSLDTLRLLESGQLPLALGYGLLSVLGGLFATWAGLILTKI